MNCIHFPIRKCSKNRYITSFDSGVGSCLGRSVIPTRCSYPSSLLTARLQPDEPPPPRWNLAKRLTLLRHNFIVLYPLAGSNIDTDVELRGATDVVRYFPRAALIGFCAPFPNMWVARGELVGRAGRLMAGAEMILLYIIMGGALLVLMRERRRLSLWLLFGITTAGCIALGFVVVNVSALYRMRYAYFILLIILGMKGVVSLLPEKLAASFGVR